MRKNDDGTNKTLAAMAGVMFKVIGTGWGLTVNREKTKVLDLDAERSSLVFLGYEFRKVGDRLFGTGRRYLHYGLCRLAWADVRRARI